MTGYSKLPTPSIEDPEVFGHLITSINAAVAVAHGQSFNMGWWDSIRLSKIEGIDKSALYEATPTKLMLTVSELAEAMEGHRKRLPDDHLPHHPMFGVELADTIIRIFDLAGAHGFDLGSMVAEKLLYNLTRPDHQRENRDKNGGKKY